MNPDDKLKEAAEKYAERIFNTLEAADARARSFLAGAAYIRETEVKALLEIVKMQRRALEVSTTSTCIGNHFVFRCICARCKALDATEQLMKDLGLGV